MPDVEQSPGSVKAVQTSRLAPQRYLGNGQSTGDARSAAAHLFFNSAALFILLISLIGIMFTFTDQLGDRLLVTAYIIRTDASEFSPLPFAERDLEKLQAAPGLLRSLNDDDPGVVENLLTGADFERLFTDVLPKMNQDTLILPIRCHSITTGAGTFLQPSDADPSRPESGVALTRLLAAVAGCSAANKLLLLDICPLVTNHDLGISLNLTADQLRDDFNALKESGVTLGNFRILLANDNGQSSGSSFACKHSAFSLFLSYCLNGGREADDAGRDDGILTAAELTRFVESSTADWSVKYRGILQRPICLVSGDDFPVAGVRELLTLPAWLEAADAQEEDNGTADDESSAEADKPADGAEVIADAASKTPDITAELLIGQLLQNWQAREQLRQSPVPVRRPRHWVLLSRNLQRAEREILAGNLNVAHAILEKNVGPLQDSLTAEFHDTIQFPWTTAFDDIEEHNALKQNVDDLQQALVEPTPGHLNLIVGSPFVEATLTRRLASVLTTTEGVWSQPQLVATAIELRRLAERSGRLTGSEAPSMSAPWLLPFLKSDIEAADRLRISAEKSLLLGRIDEADASFRQTRRLYERAGAKATEIARQLHEIHLMAMDCPAILAWLEFTIPDSGYKERASLLNAVMQGTLRLCQDPHQELLAPLLTLVRELRREVANAIKDAMLQTTTERRLALLQLQCLQPSDRTVIIDSLLNAQDCPRLRQSLPDFDTIHVPAFDDRSELLASLFSAMGVGSFHFSDSTEDQTGASLRRVLAELRADPLALPDHAKSGAWEQYVNHLFRTSFQAELLRETRFQSTLTDTLLGRLTAEHLAWQLNRLQLNEAAVAGDYVRPRQQIVRSLKHVDSTYLEADDESRAAFIARKIGANVAADGQSVTVRFSVSANTDLQPTDRGHLVVDWYAQRDKLQVLSVVDVTTGKQATADNGRSTSNQGTDATPTLGTVDVWRLRLPVFELAEGQIEFDLILAADGKDVEVLTRSTSEPLTAWIELADDSTWALPLSLQLQPDRQRAFELKLVGPDNGAIERRIEVFANEAFPMQLSVVSRQPNARDVQLQIHSGKSKLSWPVTITPGPQSVSLKPLSDGEMSIVDGQFEVRIVDVGEVVSQRTFELGVQNPASSFIPKVTFDTTTRKLSASIRRLTTSDSGTVTNTSLDIHGVEVAEGKLESLIESDASETTIDATIADDPDTVSFSVAVGIAGVPRMFLFKVNAITGTVTPKDASRVQFLTPTNGDVYPLNGEPQMSVGLLIDSPRDCAVHVGIDRNNNDYLETEERLAGGQFWRGRNVETRLIASAESGSLTLTSSVSDLAFPLSVAGVAGRQRILVQLLAGDQAITTGSTVYFVDGVPPIEFSSPKRGANVAFGLPVTLTVASDPALFHSVQEIEIGVDRNGNGLWEDDETLAPAEPLGAGTLQFNGTNAATGVFDTQQMLKAKAPDTVAEKVMAPETVLLMARAIRRLGVGETAKEKTQRTGKIIRHQLTLTDPSLIPPETGSVAGIVQTADGLGQRNVTVAIGDVTTQTDNDGRFRFASVPVGTHNIVGFTTRREGATEVEVQSNKTAEANIKLRLR